MATRLDEYLNNRNIENQENLTESSQGLRLDNYLAQKNNEGNANNVNITEELASIPTSFLNELLLNAPKSILNKFNISLPEAKTTPGKIAESVAGLGGMIAGPGKAVGLLKSGNKFTMAVKQGTAIGAARFPTDDPLGAKERAEQAAIGGAFAGTGIAMSKAIRGLFSKKDKITTLLRKKEDLLEKKMRLGQSVKNGTSKKNESLARAIDNIDLKIDKAFVESTPAQKVLRMLNKSSPKDLLSDKISPKEAQRLIKKLQTLGDDSILQLPDIAGDEMQGLLRSLARNSGGARNKISSFLDNRSNLANLRINKAVNKYLSEKEYYSTIDDIIEERGKLAKPLYEKARMKFVAEESIEKLFSDERIKRALATAKKDFGIPPSTPNNSIIMLDGVKKAIDDKIGRALSSGEKQKAFHFQKLKKELLGIIDEEVPDYARARQLFAGRSALLTAQETGKAFNKMAPAQIKKAFNGLSEGEKSSYRDGVKEALRVIIDKVPDGADPAKRIFGNPEIRNKLKVIFPKEKFSQFSTRIIEEIRAARTKFRVLGGSRTDFNISEQGQKIKGIKDVVNSTATGKINKAIGKGFDVLTDRYEGVNDPVITKNTADALLDKKKSLELLREIAERKS